jgi:hypothetical protein
LTPPEFRAWLKTQVSQIGTQTEAAARWKISKQYLGDLLKGTREPGEAILCTLGLQKIVRYERKENKT